MRADSARSRDGAHAGSTKQGAAAADSSAPDDTYVDTSVDPSTDSSATDGTTGATPAQPLTPLHPLAGSRIDFYA